MKRFFGSLVVLSLMLHPAYAVRAEDPEGARARGSAFRSNFNVPTTPSFGNSNLQSIRLQNLNGKQVLNAAVVNGIVFNPKIVDPKFKNLIDPKVVNLKITNPK